MLRELRAATLVLDLIEAHLPPPRGQVLRRVVLAPGASENFEASYLPRLNLGRLLPRGRYDMTVSLRVLEPKGATAEVPAGELVIEQ